MHVVLHYKYNNLLMGITLLKIFNDLKTRASVGLLTLYQVRKVVMV